MCTDSHQDSAEPAPGLYVVATPIGNRRDLSPRGRWLIEAASVVAAEDTRSIRRLLGETRTRGQMVSLTEHNVESRAAELLQAAASGSVAIVSEAGTPAIADPGTRLVAAAHDAGIAVFAVPGPSTLAAALSVSGFDAIPSIFLGFLPKRAGDRRKLLLESAAVAATLVFFESPRRLGSALEAVAAVLDDPMVVVCRELTKVHEEVVRGRASELALRFADTRGECAVVVQNVQAGKAAGAPNVDAVIAAMKRSDARRSASSGEVAKLFGLTRAEVYARWDEL